ncbi:MULTISPECIES: cytochrome b [Sphingomonas]|jgi:cytochrome b561|uniref:cytochrome b n=1 Tax=Sphingomonas TaxID=13687 RepID=UPI000AF544DC|nr:MULTISPECIES: cytochrome b [Sphingomonas]
MAMRGSAGRPIAGATYSRVAIAFHWAIAVLVIGNLIVGIGHESIPALRAWMPAHKAIGVTILLLTAARVAWRLAHRPPPLPAATPAWERAAAHATHWALYLLMIAVPLTGWMMVSGPEGRRALTWFGLFDLPYLPVSGGAAALGGEGHEVLGWMMAVLVAAHIAAALRHAVLLRDGVMTRMLPGRR